MISRSSKSNISRVSSFQQLWGEDSLQASLVGYTWLLSQGACGCMLSHFSHAWLFATLWTVPARLLCAWNSPGKNTGVGCYFLFQGIFPTKDQTHISWIGRQILYYSFHPWSPPRRTCYVSSGLPVPHQLQESTQTHAHRVSDTIQPSHPLSSPSTLALNLS